MTTLPHILFDSDTELIYSTVPDQSNIRELFLKSLRRGDRIYFCEFCASPFDPDNPKFCLFQLTGFPSAEYVFIEKDTLGSHSVNIAYLSSEPSDFHQLMSPASHYYRDITGRCIYDILHTGSKREINLTPGAYLVIDSIPHLRDELVCDPKNIEYCSLCRIAERIISFCRDIPSFPEIDLVCPENPDDKRFILAIPLSSYVFLLTALIWIFRTLSEDHRITIELHSYDDRAAARFFVNIPEARAKRIDSSSLMSLGELSPSTSNLAKIASAVAFNSQITTSVLCRGQTLCTDVVMYRDNDETLRFHYRDPYPGIGSMAEEFMRFFDMLDNSDGSDYSSGDQA